MKALKRIQHAVNVVRAHLHEAKKVATRSSKWPKVEKAARASHPTCAACGSTKRLQVHHKEPFHLHPELELDMMNLIVLCMDVPECHLLLGHGGSFKAYNPNVERDALEALRHPDHRGAIALLAKTNRKM